MIVSWLLVVMVVLSACSSATSPSPSATKSTPESSVASKSEPAAPPAEAPAGNPNIPDYTYIQPEGTVFDINAYYNEKDPALEAAVTIRQTGGVVSAPDIVTTPMPKAKEKFTVGFSVYYTVDEVGAMILDTMVASAKEAGVELLVNDANYDQNAQNQAVEQWILQKVDGVIIAPCDFHGVKGALDKLEAANIPVVTLNPPLAGSVDSIITYDCIEQGAIAGQMLLDYLKEQNVPLEGKVVYQTLPFVHPNAVTRTLGFVQAFEDYPNIELVELTGISPEEHYAAFEGALLANSDIIGAWGLYSSATIGMMNAKLAVNKPIPLVSIDNDKIILAGIKDGNIIGSACYSSIAPAWWGMSQMVNLLNGETIPGTVICENKPVTPSNVDEMFEHYYPGQTLAGYMAGQ